mmetsp:Transcript_4704/g.6973  ORF Transcript_4704/g.6973 Transcript_4704/m.6973 type:complete len:601 (+) Transcript_4704:122-1924(+)
MRANNIFSPCNSMEIQDKSIMAKIKTKLAKENDHGFVEYKLKLTGIEEERFNHLVSQMKYRLSEGEGEAIYEIGVTDDGIPQGLEEDEYKETLQNIRRMASKLGADVTVLCEKQVTKEEPKRHCAELLVRKYVEDCYVDVRVAVAGEQAAGKSTLIGVLTSGELDDGEGSARTNVFLHSHELESGQTSALSHQILAFDSKGNVINYSPYGQQPWQAVIEQSSKICTFIDLAGHKKYLKTTVKGIAGTEPDYVCLVVGATTGVSEMTKEHYKLAAALKLSIFVVITKTDIASKDQLQKTKEDIKKLLTALPGRYNPTYVDTYDDVMSVAKALNNRERLCPIFEVSSVTNRNMDLIRQLLNVLPCYRDWSEVKNEPFECTIDKVFNLDEVHGLVVSGLVRKGHIFLGDTVQLGPSKKGAFYKVVVQSIHRNHVSTRYAEAGNMISLEIRHVGQPEIKKDHLAMLLSKARGLHLLGLENPMAVKAFEARVLVHLQQKCFQKNYEPLVHTRNFSQPARIVSIKKVKSSKCGKIEDTPTIDEPMPEFEHSTQLLETGDHAVVRFEFCIAPVYVATNDRLLFREGNLKGIGTITSIDDGHGGGNES